MATISERAFQIWPLLVFAAKHRQLLTYSQLNECTGMFTGGFGQPLEQIQTYCLANGLPPLTMIVVSQETGLPGGGFSAIAIYTPEDFALTLQKIFAFDWKSSSPDIKQLV